MSYNEYSPLDTTLPFFSNTEGFAFNSNVNISQRNSIIPFLLKFKGIARRVAISHVQAQSTSWVYLNGSTVNPIVVNGSRTLNQWITSIRVQNRNGGSARTGLIEFDVVPVQYLPPRQRRAL